MCKQLIIAERGEHDVRRVAGEVRSLVSGRLGHHFKQHIAIPRDVKEPPRFSLIQLNFRDVRRKRYEHWSVDIGVDLFAYMAIQEEPDDGIVFPSVSDETQDLVGAGSRSQNRRSAASVNSSPDNGN